MKQDSSDISLTHRLVVVILCLLTVMPEPLQALALMARQEPQPAAPQIAPRDSVPAAALPDSAAAALIALPDSAAAPPAALPDSILVEVTAPGYSPTYGRRRDFNPDPSRAVWMSALFPGLGQIYNRRYWKLPIIVGGFMGLGYATSWNNTQLNDYTRAYRDISDSDPSTKSYMNFFPPTTKEEDLDKSWLTSRLRSRKDYYRRNRDLCIICMVGLYLLCMLDAYVDASLSHFDITPDLSMDLQPAMFLDPVDRKVSLGLNWAIAF